MSARLGAAEPLVDVAWVKANAGKPGIVFIDFQAASDLLRGHIPGAVNSNYGKDGWREERSDKVPDFLPAKTEPLGEMIGKLGIDNATHVVLVPPGMSSTDMGIGTRVYWTFKVLGHDNVSILNGGMAAYTKDKANPLQTGAAKPEAKTFKISLRKEMIATVDDIKKAKAAGVLLVDNRPEDQYVGINRHPKATANGTLEGAKNLPNGWLTVNGMGRVPQQRGTRAALQAGQRSHQRRTDCFLQHRTLGVRRLVRCQRTDGQQEGQALRWFYGRMDHGQGRPGGTESQTELSVCACSQSPRIPGGGMLLCRRPGRG